MVGLVFALLLASIPNDSLELQRLRANALSARTATIYRITNGLSPDYEKWRQAPRIAGYPIIKSRRLKPAEAREAILQLTDPATYLPPGQGLLCLFKPGYVLHVEGPGGTTNFVICFTCGDVDMGGEIHSIRPASAGKLRQTIERLMLGSRASP